MTTETESPRIPRYEHFPRLEKIPAGNLPKTVFIIPDGNRRWATANGLEEIEGHIAGMHKSLDLLRQFRELPIEAVVLWGFSADNWRRDPEKIAKLMAMFEVGIKDNIDELDSYNSRFIHLGDKDALSPSLRNTLVDAENRTKNNTGQKVAVAINFNGTNQDVRIVRKVAESVHALLEVTPGASIDDITSALGLDEDYLTKLRDGEGLIPPADLIIRTAEDTRTSDVGWLNGKSTVLSFHGGTYYPDLQTAQVEDSILKYTAVQHKFGA